MPEAKRPLKVFLCHAHSDKEAVKALYARLTKDGVDVWLDKEKLLPGAEWEYEIRKAVCESDVVVVCLSKQFNQAGFRQKEVRLALETAMEKPQGEIFIIPARLEECETLESLRKWHWVDLFESDGYEYLLRALRARAHRIGATLEIPRKASVFENLSAPKSKSAGINRPVIEEKPGQNLRGATKPQTRRKWNWVVAIAMLFAATAILAVVFGFPLLASKTANTATPSLMSVTTAASATATPARTPIVPIQNTPTPTRAPTLTSLPGSIPITVENAKSIKLVTEWEYDKEWFSYFRHVLFSPDSQRLVYIHNEYTLNDYVSGFKKAYLIQRNILDGKINDTTEISLSLDKLTFKGDQLIGLAQAGYQQPLIMWSFPDQKKLLTFQNSHYNVSDPTFSNDHSLLAASTSDGKGDSNIKGWDAVSGKLLFTITKYPDADSSIGISPDNNLLAWIRFGTARVFSIPKQQFLYAIDGLDRPEDHAALISVVSQNSVFFSPDGKLLILSGWDGVQVMNVSDGSLIHLLKRDGIESNNCWREIRVFAFSPDGHLLAVKDVDGSIGLWDTQAGNLVKVLAPPFPSYCNYYSSYGDSVLFSPNGAFLLSLSSSSSSKDKVQIWGISP